MRKLFFLYVFALLLVSGLGATAAVEYEGYTNPAGTKFPIAIYDNVEISKNWKQILSDEAQKAYFDSIKMAGFNVLLWGKGICNDSRTKNKWVPYIKSLGMNTIISTRGYSLTRSRIPYDANTPDSILLQDNWEGLKRVITNYSQDPNVWGFWSCDEPTPRNWGVPVYELNSDEVASIPTLNMINDYKGDKVAFVNFVAKSNETKIGHFATDNPGQHYITNFENYLDYMVDIFNLKFLTFDLYPVINNYSGLEPEWIIKPEYYNMMDLYGRYCRDRKIPVWLMMLSVEHSCYRPDGTIDWEYPEISEGLLRMQAMNGLAFGMKGLIYWEYGATGIKADNSSYLFKSALYDINKMVTTPTWEAARVVNEEVIQYSNLLLNATYDRSCLAVNNTLLTSTTPAFDGYQRFANPFECIKSITYNGAGVLLSHLSSDDGDYIAIVSQDFDNYQNITLEYGQTSYFERLMIKETIPGNDIGLPVNRKTVKFILKPGEMALFKYKK